MKYITFRAGFAALLFTTLFSCRTAQAPVSTVRPNAFIRIGEATIYTHPEGAAQVGYENEITVKPEANAIVFTTTAQVSPVGIDLYEDERAIVTMYEVLPNNAGYRWVIWPADKSVKVGDVVLIWLATNF